MSDTTIKIELVIPEAAVNAGAIESFARKYGWREKLHKVGKDTLPETDKDGNMIMIDNPISAKDFGIQFVKDDIMSKFKSIFVEDAKKKAELQAQAAVDSLLG